MEENAIEESNPVTSGNIIPENSPTLLVDESTSRFSGAIWYKAIQYKVILLAGLGGIGSYVAFLLSRIKPAYISLYDFDKVDSTNLSGQLYKTQDIGILKTLATARMLRDFASYSSVVSYEKGYTDESDTADIMIGGFDSMDARRLFYNKWRSHVDNHSENSDKEKCLLLDGRLAAEEFQVFAIQGNDKRAMKEYEEKWLFMESEADHTICSYKQTSFMANMIASIMVNLFVNFVANECEPLVKRDVPFMTSYSADTMFFKVKM